MSDEWRKYQTVEERLAQVEAERDSLLGENDGLTLAIRDAEQELRSTLDGVNALIAERDRLRARRTWLRHAYTECNIERRAALSSLDSTQAHLQDADRRRHNAEAERNRLREAIAPLRPYRVAIRMNDDFFAGAPDLADAILGAVAALDVEEGT